jgi:ABC-2 type transport system ATP-binding protein
VFVSSHLMSEMALTADHLIVIGRGMLIADTSVDRFIDMASAKLVRVRTPEAARFQALLGADRAATTVEPDVLEVHGLSADEVGDLAFRNRVPVYELTPQQASLEEAFMNLTSGAVEFGVERAEVAA